jgi:hypothetical protein
MENANLLLESGPENSKRWAGGNRSGHGILPDTKNWRPPGAYGHEWGLR